VPELPEVEITRRGIEPFVLGKTITGVAVRNPNLRQRVPRKLARTLVGQRVKRLERRGKYLLFECDTGSLIVHLGMSGSLRVTEPGTLPASTIMWTSFSAASYCACAIRDASAWCCGTTATCSASPARAARRRAARRAFLARVPLSGDARPRRRHQTAVDERERNVGVGNIYANESLFRAGIPSARALRKPLARTLRAAGSPR